MFILNILLFVIIPLTMDNQKEEFILDFRNDDKIPEWLIINDGVMGGISTSDIEYSNEGYLRFAGNVSLENNGGFASFRSRATDFDLSEYEGIKIRVRGDGKKYSFRLRTSSSFDGVAYAADFQSLNGEWQEVSIPFTDFTPRFRGRIILNASPLDNSNIRQLGFLISDKQKGPFALEIDWIRGY